VVDIVVDKTNDILDTESRKILKDLWTSNLMKAEGLPALEQQKCDDQKFGLELIRQSNRLTEPLPPVITKGLHKKPEIYMQRPVLDSYPIHNKSTSGITESYVLKTVCI
jgi:hypothetical protein